VWQAGKRDVAKSQFVEPIDIERLKIDCLSVVMCPLLAQLKTGFFSVFLLRLFTVLPSEQGKP
jgi:hypothetical protein